MRHQLQSRIVLVFCLVVALLVATFVQPRSLHAQISERPPLLMDRLSYFDIERPTATAFAIWNAAENQRHEVWFRILGGDALFQQRLRVYKEQAPPRTPNELPPESELVYEVESNGHSDWFFLGFESEFHTYYFDGDNRPNSGVSWDNSKAVRAKRTVYSNGDLYDVSFEDLNTLDDYNDLEIEVVLIHSHRIPQ
ncbi:MAG: hypothetical protein F6K42_24295 [Leptolyngbya sp. SIO1D8]|nr:hypothetical protein [Leptolyngbya sp. SIO1D8]